MIPLAATAQRAPSTASGPQPRHALRVGGLTPLTTTDYPGELAAVVFCQGCPWRCAYCHNPHLLAPRGAAEIAWTEVLGFLRRRRGLLDAVVFSGGEPTAQPAILDAARVVRALGFKVGLHTAGMYPRRLARLLPLVDWVGMDVKAPFDAYAETTGAADGAAVRESLKLLLASGVAHEVRTTVHPALLGPEALERLAAALAALGVTRYVVQEYRAPAAPARLAPARSYLDAAFFSRISRRFARFAVRPAAAHPARGPASD